ncbi:unnamed protein product, partial [Cyprideis torosa]
MANALRWLEGVMDRAGGRLDAPVAALTRAMAELDEAAQGVSECLNALEFNPIDLEETEERLFALRGLARKHQVLPDDLAGLSSQLSDRLVALDAGESRIADLQKAVKAAEKSYESAADALTKARVTAAQRLDAAVATELAPLKMERAVFATEISEASAGPDGKDAVQFVVATNPGAPSGPLNKIASGGELSRFLLALKVCLSEEQGDGVTMIFDEIDRGVGGATADAVGRRLKSLAKEGQILVVTHSPQVAALAESHWRVEKGVVGDVTTTTVVPLQPTDREAEIARMLSGDTVTEEARAAARALLAGLIGHQLQRWTAQLAQVWAVLRRKGPGQIQFWFIALLIGVAAGFAAIAFRAAIETLQTFVYGTDDPNTLHSFAETLHWIWVLLIPVLGGLAVGVILHHFTPDGRVRSVSDVIEGAALNDGRVESRAGLASAACSWITLSTGGSTGREGPVVHIAALISSWVANLLRVDGVTGRDLLGCAVAAAVSASFNAPIAGALFALEVVLRHFAFHAFAPIVVASAAGTVINRLTYGDVTEFRLPGTSEIGFYIELPAFFILGMVCGLVAFVMMRAIFWADDLETGLQSKLGLPRWLRPSIAGLLLGGLAIFYPHIIGVGYETTSLALTGDL